MTESYTKDEWGEIEYDGIAVELGGGLTLDDLSEQCKREAKAWAKKHNMPWPPEPSPGDLATQINMEMIRRMKSGS